MRDKIEKGIEKVVEEMKLAESDTDSDLSLSYLEGWKQALEWVLEEADND